MSYRCQRCGADIVVFGADGFCTACLLEGGLEAKGGGPPSPAAPLGTFGEYELLEEIARGGMGVVYKARQTRLNRTVALKMILAGHLASPTDVKRFLAEARAAAALQHPNIVAIHEVGVHDGQHFFSMDYVEGSHLAQLVREGPVSPARAAALVKTIAEAIQYAHEHGILHRDLKPSNILLDAAGQPHVTDFGLAKQLDDAQISTPGAQLTLSGQVLGSPNFMPPEQACGKHHALSQASDVYSLGALLYHLLTGRPPFLADSVPATLRLVAEAEPISPRLLQPNVPIDLETIMLKCLDKDPARRYPTAQALADELGRVLRDEPVKAHPLSGVEKFWRWCRRHTTIAGLAGLVASLLLAIAALLIFSVVHLRRANQAVHAKLWESYLAQARANRWSGRPGRRFESLKALQRAADINPSVEVRSEAISCLALSDLYPEKTLPLPEGSRLLTFDGGYQRYARSDSSGQLVVRQLADSRLLFAASNFPPHIEQQMLGGDGRYLAVNAGSEPGAGRELRVFDLSTATTVMQRLNEPVAIIGFSGDWAHLVTSEPVEETNTLLQAYDLKTGTVCWSNRMSELPFSLRHHNSPNRMANRDVGILKPTTVQTPFGELTWWSASLPNEKLTVHHWNFTGDMMAVGGAHGRIQVWDFTKTPSETISFGEGGQVIGLRFHPRGRLLASTAYDNSLRLWDVATGRQLLSKAVLGYAAYPFSLDGEWLACSPTTQEVELCRVADGQECLALRAGAVARRCGFSPDGQIIAAAYSDGARLWDARTGQRLAFLPLSDCHGTLFTPGDGLLVACASGLKCWTVVRDPVSRQVQRLVLERVLLPGEKIDGVQIDAAGLRAVALVVGNLYGIDLLTGRTISKTKFNKTYTLFQVSLSPDGKLCAGTSRWEQQPGVWSVDTAAELRRLPMARASGVQFSPDGRYLICGTAEAYVCWQTASWKQTWTVARDSTGGNWARIAWAPDGRMAAVTHGDHSIRLLNTETGGELATFEAPDPKTINDLTFSPDGWQLVATGNSTVHLWNLRLLRHELAAMHLDWDSTPLPAPDAAVPDMSLPQIQVIQCPVPARPSGASPKLIDLTTHFNSAFTNFDKLAKRDGNNLARLPVGEQVLDGTPFDLRGIVQLGVPECSPRATGIAIEQRCRQLNFLHSALFLTSQDVPPRKTVAEYHIHWADGETERVPVQNLVHIADWWTGASQPPSSLDTNTTSIAWRSANAAADRPGHFIQLYKFRWRNSRPEVPVASVDFEAVNGAPFLLGITAEE